MNVRNLGAQLRNLRNRRLVAEPVTQKVAELQLCNPKMTKVVEVERGCVS